MVATSARATRETWAAAALRALAEGGVEAVAVEPIAKKLGVTKGSFYWHFANRAELLDAALELWEHRGTTDIIEALSTTLDPRERLRLLFRKVTTMGRTTHGALSSSREPSVRKALVRVAKARLEFLDQCYRELGFSVSQSRHRSYLAYAAYLGMLQLARDAPSEAPTGEERDAYTEHVIATLVP